MKDWDWPCTFRGPRTGELHNCGCSSQDEQPVFACNNPVLSIRGCVIRTGSTHRTESAGLASCASCQLRDDPEGPAVPVPVRKACEGSQPLWKDHHGIIDPTQPYGDRFRNQVATPKPVGKLAKLRVPPTAKPLAAGAFVYISTRQLIEDTVKLLLPQIPPNAAAIAGVPRSGMLPASILATQLQLPLYSTRGDFFDVGSGSRGRRGWAGEQEGPIVIVDDSVYSGGNMRVLQQQHQDRAIYAAVYVRPEEAGTVDIYARALPSPHLFEWNLFNGAPLIGQTINPALHGGIALDFDGVLCHDPASHDSDEAGYTHWLENAPPLHLPRRHEVPLVVTFRLEKYREATLAWLARWGVRIKKLVMHPAKTYQERNANWNTAEHKGLAYRSSKCKLFIESDERQAKEIHEASGKPVLSLASDTIFQ